MRGVLSRSFLFLIFAGYLVAAFWYWGIDRFDEPGLRPEMRLFVLEKGASLSAISKDLHQAGLIDEPLVFRLGVRMAGAARKLQAGEYRVPATASPRQIMDLLVSGQTVVRRLTVAEGLTSARIHELVREAEGLTGEAGPIPAEGTLLPETYHYHRGDTRSEVLDRMRQAMGDALNELWASRQANLPLATPEEAVTLASIVERETSVPAERHHVAGVFTNRLKKGMRLQSDPTVAYGLAKGSLDRPLTQSDLKSRTPYNTYVVKGLPPGPIANPGRAAIEAVLNPLATKDLYFVADGTGGHAFAATLKQHLKNVRKWRVIEKQRAKSQSQ